MPRYRVYGVVTGSKFIGEFEAESKEEAEQMAWDSDEAGIYPCHQCVREVGDAEINSMNIIEIEDE